MEGHVTYELNIEVWLIVDVTCPSVTFMYRYGRTNDDSLTNKAFISIDCYTHGDLYTRGIKISLNLFF